MARFNFMVPSMLVDGDQPAMDQLFIANGYNPLLVGDAVYVEGDLCEIVGGLFVMRSHEAVPANIPPMYLAGANHAQPFALIRNGQATRTIVDVPLNVIPEKNEFIMTYTGNAADGVDYTFLAADLALVNAQTRVEIKWDADPLVQAYVAKSTVVNPTVTLLRLHKGTVGDENVQVVVRLDPNGAS
jgi:hypothetical protein